MKWGESLQTGFALASGGIMATVAFAALVEALRPKEEGEETTLSKSVAVGVASLAKEVNAPLQPLNVNARAAQRTLWSDTCGR